MFVSFFRSTLAVWILITVFSFISPVASLPLASAWSSHDPESDILYVAASSPNSFSSSIVLNKINMSSSQPSLEPIPVGVAFVAAAAVSATVDASIFLFEIERVASPPKTVLYSASSAAFMRANDTSNGALPFPFEASLTVTPRAVVITSAAGVTTLGSFDGCDPNAQWFVAPRTAAGLSAQQQHPVYFTGRSSQPAGSAVVLLCGVALPLTTDVPSYAAADVADDQDVAGASAVLLPPIILLTQPVSQWKDTTFSVLGAQPWTSGAQPAVVLALTVSTATEQPYLALVVSSLPQHSVNASSPEAVIYPRVTVPGGSEFVSPVGVTVALAASGSIAVAVLSYAATNVALLIACNTVPGRAAWLPQSCAFASFHGCGSVVASEGRQPSDSLGVSIRSGTVLVSCPQSIVVLDLDLDTEGRVIAVRARGEVLPNSLYSVRYGVSSLPRDNAVSRTAITAPSDVKKAAFQSSIRSIASVASVVFTSVGGCDAAGPEETACSFVLGAIFAPMPVGDTVFALYAVPRLLISSVGAVSSLRIYEACGPGSQWNPTAQKCTACPGGSYSNDTSMSPCVPCPAETSSSEGASGLQSCSKDLCSKAAMAAQTRLDEVCPMGSPFPLSHPTGVTTSCLIPHLDFGTDFNGTGGSSLIPHVVQYEVLRQQFILRYLEYVGVTALLCGLLAIMFAFVQTPLPWVSHSQWSFVQRLKAKYKLVNIYSPPNGMVASCFSTSVLAGLVVLMLYTVLWVASYSVPEDVTTYIDLSSRPELTDAANVATINSLVFAVELFGVAPSDTIIFDVAHTGFITPTYPGEKDSLSGLFRIVSSPLNATMRAPSAVLWHLFPSRTVFDTQAQLSFLIENQLPNWVTAVSLAVHSLTSADDDIIRRGSFETLYPKLGCELNSGRSGIDSNTDIVTSSSTTVSAGNEYILGREILASVQSVSIGTLRCPVDPRSGEDQSTSDAHCVASVNQSTRLLRFEDVDIDVYDGSQMYSSRSLSNVTFSVASSEWMVERRVDVGTAALSGVSLSFVLLSILILWSSHLMGKSIVSLMVPAFISICPLRRKPRSVYRRRNDVQQFSICEDCARQCASCHKSVADNAKVTSDPPQHIMTTALALAAQERAISMMQLSGPTPINLN